MFPTSHLVSLPYSPVFYSSDAMIIHVHPHFYVTLGFLSAFRSCCFRFSLHHSLPHTLALCVCVAFSVCIYVCWMQRFHHITRPLKGLSRPATDAECSHISLIRVQVDAVAAKPTPAALVEAICQHNKVFLVSGGFMWGKQEARLC